MEVPSSSSPPLGMQSSDIPPRRLNGGLYTGEPFWEGAPWRNIPVVPSVDFMMQHTLLSAHPPPGATVQYPASNHRPGNNSVARPGLVKYGPRHGDMLCVAPLRDEEERAGRQLRSPLTSRPQQFAKYAYL